MFVRGLPSDNFFRTSFTFSNVETKNRILSDKLGIEKYERIIVKNISEMKEYLGEVNRLVETSLSLEAISIKEIRITSYFHRYEELVWMKDVYQIIKTSLFEKIKHNKYSAGKKLVGITLPETFISEVLNFEKMEQYLNQFKIYMILLTIEGGLYNLDREGKVFKILQTYFNNKQKRFYEMLVQKYVYDFYVSVFYDSFGDIDNETIEIVSRFKKLYNNPLYQTNYEFPVNSADTELFIKEADRYYDDLDEKNEEEIIKRIRELSQSFIERMTTPLLMDVQHDILFDMAIEDKIYDEFCKKNGEPEEIFEDFFQQSLYIRLTKQPKMQILKFAEDDLFVDAYYADFEGSESLFWDKKHILYQKNQVQKEYLDIMINIKVVNTRSTVYIGNQYEKYCEKWLLQNGYSDTKRVGKRGNKGIDVLALAPDGSKVGIQCKYLTSGTVRSQDVRLLYSAKEYYDIEKYLMIANRSVAKDAISDMEKLGVVAIILPLTLV